MAALQFVYSDLITHRVDHGCKDEFKLWSSDKRQNKGLRSKAEKIPAQQGGSGGGLRTGGGSTEVTNEVKGHTVTKC